ncbi:MAG: ISAs1 family transposase [Nostoc sp.]|uniref:ISAs1 family transposase n=1 Tax=Nostoc sp. TaxID=1180 RepID=UPI002FF63B5A
MSKKTLSLIINADNDYLIGLKQNQPMLYKMAQTQLQQSSPLSCATAIDSRHSRIVKRTSQVFPVPESLQNQWAGLKTFVVVERQGERDRQPFPECQFYICSQHLEAQQLLTDTQGHWAIENRLHWVKDVTFSVGIAFRREDFPLCRGGNAPVNWAILHTFLITSARFFGFRTIPQAQRPLSNQLQKVFSLFV